MKRITIAIIVTICLAMGFAAGEFEKYKSTGPAPNLTIEKAFTLDVNPDAIKLGEKSVQDNSIFSWSTILLLSAAVIGIIVFRRNTLA